MTIPAEAIGFAKKFEPILLFHPDEKYFPIDPKFYLDRCAIWRAAPPTDKKDNWGESPAGFPRRPQVPKAQLSALKNEAAGKRWIGEMEKGVSPFMVVKKPAGELEERRLIQDDRFLQLAGWEPGAPSPNEVTASSDNRHPTLSPVVYDAALQGGRPWYFAEYFDHTALLGLANEAPPDAPDLFRLVDTQIANKPVLVVYHFFYALHEEPLQGCEAWGEGKLFGTYAGAWTSVAVLINSAGEAQFIGVTSRNIGNPKTKADDENRVGMQAFRWKEVDRVGDHPKIFVSQGTHGNYLKAGAFDLTAFTPGDVDIGKNSCGVIESLDDVIAGTEIPGTEGEDGDTVVLMLKIFLTLGIGLIFTEDVWTKFGTTPLLSPNPNQTPKDQTGGPSFGLILRPKGLAFAEIASAARIEDWPTEMPADDANPRFDFVVDRDTQLWWAPRKERLGYAGRWGPSVTNDPKRRRAGMRLPIFGLMFLLALAVI